MAEDTLEGFENLDSLAELDSDLDALLGDSIGDQPAASTPARAGAAPSSSQAAESHLDSGDDLDSFFEDLSTIDDLDGDEFAAAEGVAGAPAAAEEAPKKRAKKPKKPRQPGKGFWAFLWRWLKRLILLGLLGWGGVWLYMQFFPSGGKPPWQPVREAKTPQLPLAPPPEPDALLPPPPEEATPKPAAEQPLPQLLPPSPKPRPAKRVRLTPIPKPRQPARRPARYGMQIAACLTDDCLARVQADLRQAGFQVRIYSQQRRNELIEVLSEKTWPLRVQAEEWAQRINGDGILHGFAHAVRSRQGYRLSLGSFVDLARAKRVRDATNQRYPKQLLLNTRLVRSRYAVRKVVGEGFPTRVEAQQGLSRFIRKHPQYADAFIVDL